MKYIICLAVAIFAIVAGNASAALVPGVYDPDATGACVASWNASTAVLHLEKNDETSTNCSAGADIIGQEGAFLSQLSFNLAPGSHCGAGSVRFDVLFSDGSFRIFTCAYGESASEPNADGTTTVTFDDDTPYCDFASSEPDDCFGVDNVRIKQIDILLDEEGTADVSGIMVNGVLQVVVPKAPIAPDEPGHTFLCYSAFKGSIPGVYLIGDAPGFVKAGTLFTPYAVAGNVPGGNNLGSFHLVCNVDGLKATGNVISGEGQLFGPEYYSQYQAYFGPKAPNVYPVYG